MHSNVMVGMQTVGEGYIPINYQQNWDVNLTSKMAPWKTASEVAMLIGWNFGESALYSVVKGTKG